MTTTEGIPGENTLRWLLCEGTLSLGNGRITFPCILPKTHAGPHVFGGRGDGEFDFRVEWWSNKVVEAA